MSSDVAELTGYPTFYDLAGRLLVASDGKKKATRFSQLATEGVVPKRPLLEADRPVWLGPAELSDVIVPVSPTGVGGQQRDPTADAEGRRQVRKIAEAIKQGDLLPDLLLGLIRLGEQEVVICCDGGHRGCGSFVARLPVRCLPRRMTLAQAKQLFIGQSKARPIRAHTFVTTGDGPLDLYVQDALTSDVHPWASLVALKAGRGRLSPAQMAALAGMYGCNQIRGTHKHLDQARFNPDDANELALLLSCFGSHEANPLAHRDKARRATVLAAIHCILRSERRSHDAKRWERHMPDFRFAEYAHIREATGLCDSLIAHWNKRLPPERKVQR